MRNVEGCSFEFRATRVFVTHILWMAKGLSNFKIKSDIIFGFLIIISLTSVNTSFPKLVIRERLFCSLDFRSDVRHILQEIKGLSSNKIKFIWVFGSLITIYLTYIFTRFQECVIWKYSSLLFGMHQSSTRNFEQSSCYPSSKLNLFTFLESSIWPLWNEFVSSLVDNF